LRGGLKTKRLPTRGKVGTITVFFSAGKEEILQGGRLGGGGWWGSNGAWKEVGKRQKI